MIDPGSPGLRDAGCHVSRRRCNDVVLEHAADHQWDEAGDDTFLLTGTERRFRWSWNGASPIIYTNPFNITINGREGDDSLTVDFVSGQAIPRTGCFITATSKRRWVIGFAWWARSRKSATYLPNGMVDSALDNDGTVHGRWARKSSSRRWSRST